MSYCTPQDLIERFTERELIQTSDRSNSGTVNMAVVNAAITDASDEIDGYLRARYDLPLADIPPAVKRVACDMARYYLFTGVMIEIVKTRYDAARKWLSDIAAGRVSLESTSQSTGSIAVTAPVSGFGGDVLEAMQL